MLSKSKDVSAASKGGRHRETRSLPSVEATIDLATIDTNDPARDAHLRSSTSSMSSDTDDDLPLMASRSRQRVVVDGELRCTGITPPVSLALELHGSRGVTVRRPRVGFSRPARSAAAISASPSHRRAGGRRVSDKVQIALGSRTGSSRLTEYCIGDRGGPVHRLRRGHGSRRASDGPMRSIPRVVDGGVGGSSSSSLSVSSSCSQLGAQRRAAAIGARVARASSELQWVSTLSLLRRAAPHDGSSAQNGRRQHSNRVVVFGVVRLSRSSFIRPVIATRALMAVGRRSSCRPRCHITNVFPAMSAECDCDLDRAAGSPLRLGPSSVFLLEHFYWGSMSCEPAVVVVVSSQGVPDPDSRDPAGTETGLGRCDPLPSRSLCALLYAVIEARAGWTERPPPAFDRVSSDDLFFLPSPCAKVSNIAHKSQINHKTLVMMTSPRYDRNFLIFFDPRTHRRSFGADRCKK